MLEWSANKIGQLRGAFLAVVALCLLPAGPLRAGCGDHVVTARAAHAAAETSRDGLPDRAPSCSGGHCSRPSPLAPTIPSEEQKLRIGKPVLDALVLVEACAQTARFAIAASDLPFEPDSFCDIFHPPRL